MGTIHVPDSPTSGKFPPAGTIHVPDSPTSGTSPGLGLAHIRDSRRHPSAPFLVLWVRQPAGDMAQARQPLRPATCSARKENAVCATVRGVRADRAVRCPCGPPAARSVCARHASTWWLPGSPDGRAGTDSAVDHPGNLQLAEFMEVWLNLSVARGRPGPRAAVTIIMGLGLSVAAAMPS